MDIQRLEDFPAYISCIRNYGRPILPPLLSPTERKEMIRIRHEAIIAETRIARRAIQPNLMMRIKEVIENIEKSEINLLKNDSLSVSIGGSSDLVDLSASEASLYLHMSPDMPSISVFDSHQQGGNNVKKNDSDEISSVTLENKIQEVLFVSEPTDLIHEGNTPCKNLVECKSSCQRECFGLDDYNSVVSTSLHEQNSEYFCQESIDSHDVLERPNQSKELLISDSSNVPQDPKTSDGDEVESESVTTVILKSQGDNHNDTDSDSVITSLAHSTDLEKYFDSSCENGNFSENSIQTESEKETTCIMSSVLSDVDNSDTIINTDVNTPLPSLESSRAESSCDKYARSFSNQSFTLIEDENSSKDETKASACRQHIRRSSYTLERPSPALIQACASYNCDVNSDNVGNSVHAEFLPTSDSLLYKITASQIPLTNTPSEDMSEILLEAGDSIHVRPALLESQIVRNQNVWAYKIMQPFSQSPELTVSAFTPSGNSCDIIRDSSRVLLAYEPFSDTNLTPDTPTEVLKVPSQYYVTGPESDLETNYANAHTTEFHTSQWLPSEKPPQSAETSVACNIFQNLQDLQKQKVEQFLKQQREQWERLQMEFKDQEWLLCCQLQSSLSSSEPSASDDVNKNIREVDDGVLNPKVSAEEKNVVEDTELHKCPAIIVNASAVTNCHHSMKNKTRKKMSCNEDLDPSMKAKFDRVSAAVKGYLTRRLLKTERVQGIIQTMKDTLICAVKFHEETPIKKGEITQQDAELHQRFIVQLTAACYELHDIFFKLSTKEQMMIISQSREISREKKNKIPHLPIASVKENDAISKGSAKNKNQPMISSATIKALERKKARSLTGGGPLDHKFGNRNCMQGAHDRLHNALNHNLHIKSPSSSIFKKGRPTTPVKRNSSWKSPANVLKSVRRLVYHKADVNSTSKVSTLDG